MKIKFKIVSVIICLLVLAVSFTACAKKGDGTQLGRPNPWEGVEDADLDADSYAAFKKYVEKFAADFAASAYSEYDKQDNFAVSPISVYMALALSAECAANNTRQEILDAIGVTHQQLKTHFSTMYRSLAVEHKTDDTTTGLLKLTNSIWVNEGTEVKQPCIDVLSGDYYAYSYSADFENNKDKANKAVRDFVKKETNGLIDKDFDLSKDTLFALINALYLKTIWNTDGNDLPFAKDKYNFTAKDGSVKNVNLLQGYYKEGRVVELDTFSTFYTSTYNGYKIKFILPKDNYTIDQVFSAENIAKVNSITNYGAYNAAGTERYLTRVLFPEYKCTYDADIADILKDKFNIDLLFKNPEDHLQACDFSTLTDEPGYCDKIQHVTNLTVNRKGIEGAAVTVVSAPGAAGFQPAVNIYADFIVNKSFGFIITDKQDITLFSGVVNNI